MTPAWMSVEQASAWRAGTEAADEAWRTRPRRRVEDAPVWYTPEQAVRWVAEG